MKTSNRAALVIAGLALACVALAPIPALAVPSFALQTGQPCTACHIGAYGPQLTQFGRAFKITAYTQNGGNNPYASLPVSAMVLGSYTNTSQGQGGPAATHYGSNGNFALDQISVFLGGRVTDNIGGLAQGTFNGIATTLALDNTDLRASWPVSFAKHSVQLGVDVNNGPTVQDPFGGSYAWGYPYVGSRLAPTPHAQPLLAGALIGNSVGATLYAWYDQSLYIEGGLYNTYSPRLLSFTGSAYGPGSTARPAPYGRVAYEWNWASQSAYVGGIFLHSDINPATGAFTSDSSFGRDSYTDYALDGDWQYLGDGTNTLSLVGIVNHEQQQLNSSFGAGVAGQAGHTLNQVRANLSYYYRQTYGATLGWQNTAGSADATYYAAAPLSGSANGKPDSNAFLFEADWVPFGKVDSAGSPWANLKLAAQYTLYTRFNGGTQNYDGFGRNAADNNTIYLAAWFIF